MSLLASLKSSTADRHEALEAGLDVMHRVRSIDDYRALLNRFYAVHAPLEHALAAAFDWRQLGWDFDGRRKSPLLFTDLKALGATPPTGLALAAGAFCPATLAEAVGTLYVVEGSTLGGQMISRHFTQLLGLTPETGGKFFHGYGPATGNRWREYCQWAEALAARGGPDFETDAIRAARATFEAFGRGLAG